MAPRKPSVPRASSLRERILQPMANVAEAVRPEVRCTSMGTLTEATFSERVTAGCTACGAKKLFIRSYVEGKFPLMGGEPAGVVAWAYKGETFVDGVFEISCLNCKHIVFSDTICPRCHAPDGLARAL